MRDTPRCDGCPVPAGLPCRGEYLRPRCGDERYRAYFLAMATASAPDPEPAEDPGLPGLARQASGFVATAAAVLGSGFEMAPEAEQRSRWSACRACPNLREADLRCGGDDGCGCHLPRKIPFAAASCPLGKW